MKNVNFLTGESDIFVGKRRTLKRYLVCSLQGYFPVCVKTGPNSMAAVFRTGGPHVGISATLAVSVSEDGGKSWSDPVEVVPRWQDARNPAFGYTSDGRLILSFWKAGLTNYRLDEYGKVWNRNMTEEEKLKASKTPSFFIMESTNKGKTWSEPKTFTTQVLLPVFLSPYGRIIEAPDGTLLMPAYGNPKEPIDGVRDASILIRSKDGGKTWGDESIVAYGYNETSYVFLPDGTLVAAARSDKGQNLAILRSSDNGYTWSKPIQVTRDMEHPADLTLLNSGKLLMTFGRRIRPMGCGALISCDGGLTWDYDKEVLLAGDGILNGDLGYPSTVQLDDGKIVTLLYYASGSQMSAGHFGWGDVSCQAIHYYEEDIT
jgi:sialidase-1